MACKVKVALAHDVYFEDNTSLEILDDVEMNINLENLKVHF
jgi:hypothetical protein